jgi:two-component system response regulator YesN
MTNILLVDDDAMVLDGLRTTIDWDGNGFTVVALVSNGARALEVIESQKIDILVTDIVMPVMDGLELTRKTREKSPDTKILLLSSYNDFEYAREGIRLGASDYLLKPTLESEDLIRVLDEIRQQLKPDRRSTLLGHIRENTQDHEWGFHKRLVNKALDYMDEHYTEIITLQDVADHIAISKNYFSEIFKKVTGHNFIDHLIYLRLYRAQELLTTTSLKIYEIAELCGFNDVKYFSKLFRNKMNLSPADYRNRE